MKADRKEGVGRATSVSDRVAVGVVCFVFNSINTGCNYFHIPELGVSQEQETLPGVVEEDWAV
jgi:hypothetical protein